MQRQWIIRPEANPEEIKELSEAINVSKPVANLLMQRGINTFNDAKKFFRPDLADLHDPFLMKDMHLAVSRLEIAINNQEGVMVYGDYDVDGTTSVSMMVSFLRGKISNLHYHIPDRYQEGYGISFKGIDTAKENNCTLIIALDCGIKAMEKVDYANDNGIDFIICDHHEPSDEIPMAIAVLDPKRSDCNYPFKELSACGVGFKFIQAYAKQNNIDFFKIEHYLDLVALSIAADIVPIIDENRILAYFGLKRINTKPRIGLKAILNIANAAPGNLKINDLVFKVSPRINAAGRMEQGRFSVDLLVCKDKNDAAAMAEKIDGDNTERKWFDSNITKEALEMIKNNTESENRKSTVLYNPEWHKGVIGIVASRIIDHYYKPTVILSRSNGFVTGSARSVSGFNVYKAIEQCQHLLENFGGHMYAAGITLKEENVDAFISEFEKAVQKSITPESQIPKINIDEELYFEDIKANFLKILNQFEPFGPGNMPPVFVTKNVRDTGYAQRVGAEGDHLKMNLMDLESTKSFPSIAFKQGEHLDEIYNKNFDICYSIEENNYKGRTSIQLKIRDIKTT
ncbi:MAG: single-stranded-DNA-specific exonuclease RecJ [Salinivirgaceae bacterium]|jgi:single-stranded-DNA-specific exonuclease|nr:single-stranded-DNA-specific exonuclease RecJ [Salinivirgaceae bacterium]